MIKFFSFLKICSITDVKSKISSIVDPQVLQKSSDKKQSKNTVYRR